MRHSHALRGSAPAPVFSHGHRASRSTGLRTSSFVVVTDRLPGSGGAGRTVLGVRGVADDPVTSALAALVADLGGSWVGRSPTQAPSPRNPALRELRLTPTDIDRHTRHTNDCIWPVFHDLVRPARFDSEWQRAYRRINAAHAAAAGRCAAHGATVWVHDLHLLLVPALLRRARPDLRIGFYLDSPFPPVDLFQRMPMWRDLLTGIAAADHVGFPTARSAENFLCLTDQLTGPIPTVGVHPTAVDSGRVAELSVTAATERAAQTVRARVGNPATVILSVGTADEAHGLEQRLATIEGLFRGRRLTPGEAVVIQIIVGDPATNPETLERIAQKTARINGTYAAVGRPCVHHVVDSPPLAERVALMRAADLMLATPLCESATPAALEFTIAARPDAALVLSEFSGTAQSLSDAYIVNPYDVEATADTIIGALAAPPAERERRMALMRPYPLAYDTYDWATHFVLALNTNTYRGRCPAEPAEDSHPWPAQAAYERAYDDDWLLNEAPRDDDDRA